MSASDCWRRIGTGGDLSCAELKRHVHCRNCPVFVEAAAGLGRRDPPPGYTDSAIEIAALPAPAADRLETAFLFRFANQWLAIETRYVVEVAAFRSIHRIPHREGLVAGLVNVRGQLLLAIHLRALLQVSSAEETTKPAYAARIVVIGDAPHRWAFVADEVSGVGHFNTEEQLPAPANLRGSLAGMAAGTIPSDKGRALLLAGQALFEVLQQRVTA